MWLAFAGRYRDALAISERAGTQPIFVTGAGKPGRLSDNGTASFGLAHVYAAFGRPLEAMAAFTYAYELSRAGGGFTSSLQFLLDGIERLVLPYFADDLERRRHLLVEIDDILAYASGAFHADEPADLIRLSLLYLEGDWERARAIARSVCAVQQATNHRLYATRLLGPLARNQGIAAEAWSLVRSEFPGGLAATPGDVRYIDALCWQRLACMLALDEGDLTTARAWLEQHDRWLAWSGTVPGRSEGALAWAHYHRQAGEDLQAHQCASRALAHAGEPRQPLALLASHRLLGELDTAAGRYDDARSQLDTALALADACAAPYERALTLLALADLRVACGDRAKALTMLDEVRAICTPLGAKPALVRAEALAAHLAGMKVAAPVYPAGLTAREVEVLRLVAAGRTNREIAELLSVSAHTVMNHVAHIMTKTDTDNRAAAAAFALRHGLA
jgi:DNA-binding CsgD family transcriptional regulator